MKSRIKNIKKSLYKEIMQSKDFDYYENSCDPQKPKQKKYYKNYIADWHQH